MEASELYAPDHHWGNEPIDLAAWNLPALKARYLVSSLPPRGRVLEVGCGGGRILNTIASELPELDLHGCDIRPLDHTPEQFQFTLLDPSRDTLPYDEETFDVVVLFDVLEHVRHPAALLKAVHAVLRPGGVAVSYTPLEGQRLSFYRMYQRLLGDDLYVETKEHIHAFSEAGLRSLVEAELALGRVEYAYHLLGHLMDATLFALTKLPALRKRFWQANPYYGEDSSSSVDATSTLGSVMKLANALAFAESSLLRHHRLGSAGMLFTAERQRNST